MPFALSYNGNWEQKQIKIYLRTHISGKNDVSGAKHANKLDL